MISCRQAADLVSQGLDRRLRLGERLRLRLHLAMCRSCTHFATQLRFLRRAAAALSARSEARTGRALPDDARERIRRRLRQG